MHKCVITTQSVISTSEVKIVCLCVGVCECAAQAHRMATLASEPHVCLYVACGMQLKLIIWRRREKERERIVIRGFANEMREISKVEMEKQIYVRVLPHSVAHKYHYYYYFECVFS